MSIPTDTPERQKKPLKKTLNHLLPKKINVGGITYDVKISDIPQPPTTTEGFLERYEIQGYCDFGKAEIRLGTQLENKDILLSVFFHEITHALAHSLGFDFDENDVQGLSQGLFRLFKDNKWEWFK